MRQLRFFERLGPIGTLNLLQLIGMAEAFLPALARDQGFVTLPEAFLYWLWLIVSGFYFLLARHFIYVEGSWAMGKAPALRSGCRKWFVGFSSLHLAFSLLVLIWLTVLGRFGWLAAEAGLVFVKLQLVLRGNRLFRPSGERSYS